MRRVRLILAGAALALGCGHGGPKPSYEGNPDWVGRVSGVFPGPKGAAKIEGIAAGRSQDKADSSACREAARILRLRAVAMLPAAEPADALPALKLQGERVIARWDNGRGGPFWSLCALERDGVKRTLERSIEGRLKDFMLVHVDQMLAAPPK